MSHCLFMDNIDPYDTDDAFSLGLYKRLLTVHFIIPEALI